LENIKFISQEVTADTYIRRSYHFNRTEGQFKVIDVLTGK